MTATEPETERQRIRGRIAALHEQWKAMVKSLDTDARYIEEVRPQRSETEMLAMSRAWTENLLRYEALCDRIRDAQVQLLEIEE